MQRKVIKIMPEYRCYPVWMLSDEGFYEVTSPNHLPISNMLKELLDGWQKKYEETFDEYYPPWGGFKTPAEESAFNDQGTLIFNMMTEEIGSDFDVKYFLDGIVYNSPGELIAVKNI
jgi:hypothetical protein